MFPTTLVYSSHNRCEYIHREWIVERALRSPYNKTILYLPMSMGEKHQQEYTWSTFSWYFARFAQYGLHAIPFFWSDSLRKQDVDLFFEYLRHYEVVILGGGNSFLGMQRYRALGEVFYGDSNLFSRILHERQNEGKLTVGFSAGADQLCEYISCMFSPSVHNPYGFSLARNVVTTLHHEWGHEGEIYTLAQNLPHCMAFGLPNDSGLAVDQGYLPSGNIWQIIEFLIDCSWDSPQDGWHIKTRRGMKIDHFYPDGRHWSFNGGEKIVRVMSTDNRYMKSWIVQGNSILEYWSQKFSEFSSIDEILANH